MARWIGILAVAMCTMVWSDGSAQATDHAAAKSLTRSATAAVTRATRTCVADDMPGNWRLVAFESASRVRDPQAPYLLPHQVFQYAPQGDVKSAHSRRPIEGALEQVFAQVPSEMRWRLAANGRLTVATQDAGESVETWACTVVLQDRPDAGDDRAPHRGDLVMTLLGSDGQVLFTRRLRKAGS